MVTRSASTQPCSSTPGRLREHACHWKEMQRRLTFVVGPVHFDHHVIQLLLLQHADALTHSHMVIVLLLKKLLAANSVQIPHLLTV